MAAESSLRDFRDLKLIGKGSFGRVYRCIRISDGCDYAMKEVAIKAMSQREREDAVNEVRILASVHHQMVIRSSPAHQFLLFPPSPCDLALCECCSPWRQAALGHGQDVRAHAKSASVVVEL
jgi:serine/threonine protein kinase